jgi:hypothetical protein
MQSTTTPNTSKDSKNSAIYSGEISETPRATRNRLRLFNPYKLTSYQQCLAVHQSNLSSSSMAVPQLKHFRDGFRVSTWLLIGAAIQITLVSLLPPYLAIMPTLLLLLSRLGKSLLIRQGVLRDPSFDNVRLGRYSTQIPLPDGSTSPTPSDQQVVVFILGTRTNQYVQTSCVESR